MRMMSYYLLARRLSKFYTKKRVFINEYKDGHFCPSNARQLLSNRKVQLKKALKSMKYYDNSVIRYSHFMFIEKKFMYKGFVT